MPRQRHHGRTREERIAAFESRAKTAGQGTLELLSRSILCSARQKKWVSVPTRCSGCGKDDIPADLMHGHHTDYRRPLDVVWLCCRCHRQEHARLRRASGYLGTSSTPAPAREAP